jgi:hypothetical protein
MGLRVAIQRKHATVDSQHPATVLAQTPEPSVADTTASGQRNGREADIQEGERTEERVASNAGHDIAQIRIFPELTATPPPAPPATGTNRAIQRHVQPDIELGDAAPRDRGASGGASAARYGFDFGAIAIYPPAVQRAAVDAAPMPSAWSGEHDLARRIQTASGTGSAIETNVQRRLESSLSADLSGARVHTDSEADTLARSLNAEAFTTGPDIFFRAGTYQPHSATGMQLLAHEATHVVQQAAGPVAGTPAPGGISLSDPADPFEQAAAQRAAQIVTADSTARDESAAENQPAAPATMGQITTANGLAVQRDPKDGDPAGGAATPGVPSFQQINKPPATNADLKDLPPRNEIELIGVRLKTRQTDFASFLKDAKGDVDNIKAYFKWVTDVYDRSYSHYDLLLKQANEQADSQQAVVDFIFGVALGVAVGALSEVTLGAWAADTAFELLAEVAAEGAEGGLGLGAAAAGIKPEIAKAKVSDDLNPAFKKIQALQQLDGLNSAVLTMAIPGPLVYADPIVQTERLSAELRVAEAKGERKMSDLDIRQAYLKLMQVDLRSLQLENAIKVQQGKFDALRAAYMGKQAPTDVRTEQDIWIPWIAKQETEGAWLGLFDSILEKRIITNHFVDIGLAAYGSPGGRLNADAGASNSAITPMDAPVGVPHLVPGPLQLKKGAIAAQSGVTEFWKDVFLMGAGKK